ncbi:hypothetical protein BDZ91DRAFT_535543 [Kalaharituber pfeilii]|nr:hypothetical protein BDZ91DRAFT_535543 [Kalaharituber pfeilii]
MEQQLFNVCTLGTSIRHNIEPKTLHFFLDVSTPQRTAFKINDSGLILENLQSLVGLWKDFRARKLTLVAIGHCFWMKIKLHSRLYPEYSHYLVFISEIFIPHARWLGTLHRGLELLRTYLCLGCSYPSRPSSLQQTPTRLYRHVQEYIPPHRSYLRDWEIQISRLVQVDHGELRPAHASKRH